MQRGVCGSDIHYFTEGGIGGQVVQYPFCIGHEMGGVVESVGARVQRVKPGDRIAVDPALPCLRCSECARGHFHTCTHQRFLGCPGQIEGCIAEYIVMPERNCYRLPENLSFEQAALMEPLSIGVHAASLAADAAGASAAVLGQGPIGLSVALALRAVGVKTIFVSDKLPYRTALARSFGADFAGSPQELMEEKESGRIGDGFDIVFDATGKQDALDDAVKLLRPCGQLLIIGIPTEERISFNISQLRRKELRIQNVRRQLQSVGKAIELASSGQAPVEKMITHRFAIEAGEDAFSLVADYADGVVKAMISLKPGE